MSPFFNNAKLFNPARNEDESFEDYKVRRDYMNRYSKAASKGIVDWKSSEVGTYRKKDYEPTNKD